MEPGAQLDVARAIATVADLVRETGGDPRLVTAEADLERDLGLGSLERAELVSRLGRAIPATVPTDAVMAARTARALVDLAASQGANAATQGSTSATIAASAPSGPRDFGAPPAHVSTLARALQHRAARNGDETHIHLLEDDGSERKITYAGLLAKAERVASGLSSLGVARGDRVVIVLPTSEDFFVSFAGALCAGCVAVPFYPPLGLMDLEAYVARQARLLDDAGARVIVTDERFRPAAALIRDRSRGRVLIATVAELAAGPAFGVVGGEADDLALIQYSSGSTGVPKGVALSHANLIANIRAMGVALEIGPDDVAVSWLPLYHDLGLIALWLSALYHAVPLVVLAPTQFLARPVSWLRAIHRFGGTMSGAPNFAYDLCARTIPDDALQGLDLSRWRFTGNGAEPVRPDTIERFCKRFGPYGFRREAMAPIYGMAETCVGLTAPPMGRGPRYDVIDRDVFLAERRAVPATPGTPPERTLTVVSCGRVFLGHEARIVDPERKDGPALPERTEGLLLFRGPSTMRGYFHQPEATAAARVGEWTDSGDLAYVADGEVYIAGRQKDVVIKAGRKYHPQDIERAADSVEGVRKGCVVAFAAPAKGGGEAIVVLCETREPAARHAALEAAVARAVTDAIGAPPDKVLLLPPRTIPKTTSGKLRRRESRARYIDGTLRARPGPAWLALAGLALRSSVPRARTAGATGARAVAKVAASLAAAAVMTPATLTVAYACRSRGQAWWCTRAAIRLTAALTGLSPRLEGGPVPRSGAILVSNHTSYLDGLLLTAAIGHPVTFTGKGSLFDAPVLGRMLTRLGHTRLDRASAGEQVRWLDAAKAALAAGEVLHVFPEATFTPAQGVRPFRLGAFHLARELGLPIVPIALRGARGALRDGDRLLTPGGPVEVEVLAPVTIPRDAGFAGTIEVRDRVRRLIAEAAREPLLEVRSAALPEGTTS